MFEDHIMTLSLTVYKIVTICAGLAFTFMGYKLFIHGIFTGTGDMQVNWDDKKLVLKKSAPGTFFAIFGTIIVCVSLWRGLSFEHSQGVDAKVARSSALFAMNAAEQEQPDPQNPSSQEEIQQVLNGIALFNRFETDLVSQQANMNNQNKDVNLRLSTEDSERFLNLMDRAKLALMLSVWSEEWGDAKEFSKWAQGAPGYYHSDPPTSIAQAAAIFKGEIK